MSENNRIQSTPITPTTPRQTPDQEFGKVLQKSVHAGVDLAMKLASPIVGPSIASAAGNVISAVVGHPGAVAGKTAQAMKVPSQPITVGQSGTSGSPGGSTTAIGAGGDQWDMLEAQRLMNSENQMFNLAYLQLQDAMQKESREFNAISNIMKVRHDSAKAAINNIR
jgi:hypothetical protein